MIVTTAKADTSFVKFGSSWKYFDRGMAAPAGWQDAAFSDAGWKSGPAELGYGNHKERTTLSFGKDPDKKYITSYFRKTFTITDISFFATLRLNAYIDDGAIIYVNGKEVGRFNLKNRSGYAALAEWAEENGNAITSFDIPAGNFISGSNTIAVEVHQSSQQSHDLAFDMEVVGKPAPALPGSPVNALTVNEPDVLHGPYLQMVTPNAITIRWTTSAPVTSRVIYGIAENRLGLSVSDKKATTDHIVRISGLKPDTRYFYAIGTRNSVLKGSYRNNFNTAPPATTKRTIRIGVLGDPGTGTTVQKLSRDNYLRLKGSAGAELLLFLGDNAYNAGTETEHNLHFFNIYNNNLFDNHVVFPVPGNHEYANDKGRAVDHNIPYYTIFTVPTKGESGGLPSGTPHYYSFDYGNAHFIMLDSYGIDGGSHLYDDTTNGEQALWLKADLAANVGKHKWTIACMHHPPYTNGSHHSDQEGDLIAIRRKITPILERFGVDLVLAGHSHVYERSYLIRDHIGFSESFNNGTVPGGVALSRSSARYDGSAGNRASMDTNASTGSCPYFTIDTVLKRGTVYVVAGSAGQVNASSSNSYPVFYTRNQSTSNGGEAGTLYLEIQDNRLDAKFIGNSGIVRDQFTIMKDVNRHNNLQAVLNKPVTLSASWPGSYFWSGELENAGNNRQQSVRFVPKKAGVYTCYVSDSAGTNACITDTFTIQASSGLSSSVSLFHAIRKQHKAIVRWTAGAPQKGAYFAIERAIGNGEFEFLMAMDAGGEPGKSLRFEYTDNLINTNLPVKYRLLATDENNQHTVAGIVDLLPE